MKDLIEKKQKVAEGSDELTELRRMGMPKPRKPSKLDQKWSDAHDRRDALSSRWDKIRNKFDVRDLTWMPSEDALMDRRKGVGKQLTTVNKRLDKIEKMFDVIDELIASY